MENQRFVPGDPILIENIVSYLKAKGLFDEFRHECLADVDTKSSYQNMSQRVDGFTTKFLMGQPWNPDMNKNELRNKLRKTIDESGMLGLGSDHVVEQVINPKIGQLVLPKITEVVHQYVREENEKLNKKLQINEVSSTTESNDGNSMKTKTPVLDPIADILSFTKPKFNPPSTVQKSETVHKKGIEVSQKIDKKKEDEVSQKIDRKKEDVNLSAKSNEVFLKHEKKEEENVQPIKSIEISVKNEDVLLVSILDSSVTPEKISADAEVKLEAVESVDEDEAGLKSPDLKEIKLKKEVKPEEVDLSSDSVKKSVKDEVKVEKKKIEDIRPNEGINSSEDNKTNSITSKSNNHNKPKHEPEKFKKGKIDSSKKIPSSIFYQHKQKLKEISDSKLQSNKHSKNASSKLSKSSKESSSSSKGTFLKPVKKEKSEDDGIKIKPSDSQSNKPSSSTPKKSAKPSSLKVELSKSKSDKPEKEKHSKEKISKPKGLLSSSNIDKGNKIVYPSSSSYDSSQSSDFDKSQQVSSEDQKKQKHYSKHNKRNASTEKSSTKDTKKSSDLKQTHKITDQTSLKKHKNENSSKLSFKDKLKEDMLLHDSAKTISRSNSLSGSTSSSMSKDAHSDDACESSSKHPEKKKKSEKEPCSTPQIISRPPSPPPPSSDLVITETTSSSQDDTTQESGTLSSEEESYSEEESSDEDSSDSDENSDSHKRVPDQNNVTEPADLSEIYDSFLYSSSSSDFEGFCSSPEMKKGGSSDLSVSSVHTSDLSSYEDEVSVEDLSSEDGPEIADQKVKKKLTLKEAQEFLRNKEARKSLDLIKDPPYEGTLIKEKSSEIALPASVSTLTSKEENSPSQEPRRELRRERKLNPKYASNEYTSIFNSKRTSFITKQMNLSPQKSPSTSANNTNKLTQVKSKEKSVTNKNCVITENNPVIATSNNILPSASDLMNNNPLKKTVKKRALESESADDSSCIENNLESCPPIKLSINIKSTSIKSIQNKIAKDLSPNGMKRKFDGSDKTENKRLCIRNSMDIDSTKNDVNENKTFNNQNIEKSVLSSNNLHKQKANGDVLRKVDPLRKSSHSKPNCTPDKNK